MSEDGQPLRRARPCATRGTVLGMGRRGARTVLRRRRGQELPMKHRSHRGTGLIPLGFVIQADSTLRVPASIEASPIAFRDWEAAVGTRIAARARPSSSSAACSSCARRARPGRRSWRCCRRRSSPSSASAASPWTRSAFAWARSTRRSGRPRARRCASRRPRSRSRPRWRPRSRRSRTPSCARSSPAPRPRTSAGKESNEAPKRKRRADRAAAAAEVKALTPRRPRPDGPPTSGKPGARGPRSA